MRTDGKCYYAVKVQFTIISDKGAEKKITEQYVVLAVSVTDAEAITTKYFESQNSDFKITSVTETKTIEVLTKESVEN
jgi:hypothetical protein